MSGSDVGYGATGECKGGGALAERLEVAAYAPPTRCPASVYSPHLRQVWYYYRLCCNLSSRGVGYAATNTVCAAAYERHTPCP
eukprot:2972222-Rhodomonas_salina.1